MPVVAFTILAVTRLHYRMVLDNVASHLYGAPFGRGMRTPIPKWPTNTPAKGACGFVPTRAKVCAGSNWRFTSNS